MAKEKLTWFDSKGQEYYFDYPIMKERDAKAIENCSFEQLLVMDELLYFEEARGMDVTETREKVWEVINSKPHLKETKSELENHWFRIQRLKEQGFNMAHLPDEVFQRLVELVDEEDEKRLEKLREELQGKQYPLRPEKEDAV